MNLLAKLNHAEQIRVRNDIDQGRYDLLLVDTDIGRACSRSIKYDEIAFAHNADRLFDAIVDEMIKELRGNA